MTTMFATAVIGVPAMPLWMTVAAWVVSLLAFGVWACVKALEMVKRGQRQRVYRVAAALLLAALVGAVIGKPVYAAANVIIDCGYFGCGWWDVIFW